MRVKESQIMMMDAYLLPKGGSAPPECPVRHECSRAQNWQVVSCQLSALYICAGAERRPLRS